jgi:hypothetical protein
MENSTHRSPGVAVLFGFKRGSLRPSGSRRVLRQQVRRRCCLGSSNRSNREMASQPLFEKSPNACTSSSPIWDTAVRSPVESSAANLRRYG